MVAGIEWENVNVAGAFVLGAILATFATIRVVRAVTSMLTGELRSRPRRRTTPGDPEPADTDDQPSGD